MSNFWDGTGLFPAVGQTARQVLPSGKALRVQVVDILWQPEPGMDGLFRPFLFVKDARDTDMEPSTWSVCADSLLPVTPDIDLDEIVQFVMEADEEYGKSLANHIVTLRQRLHDANNAEWLTTLHLLCTDVGVPQGHIAERVKALDETINGGFQDDITWLLQLTGLSQGVPEGVQDCRHNGRLDRALAEARWSVLHPPVSIPRCYSQGPSPI